MASGAATQTVTCACYLLGCTNVQGQELKSAAQPIDDCHRNRAAFISLIKSL
jgi:hypothetical protein